MNANGISIEKLSEKLNGSLWTKGDFKRIYLNDEGYNTKKMSTKTFVYEQDGEFKVSCHIDCPSQASQWIASQEKEVKDSVYSRIERIIEEETAEYVYAVVKNNEYYYDIENTFGLYLWQVDDYSKIYSREKADKVAEAVGGEVIQYSKEEFQAMIDKAESVRAALQLEKQVNQIEEEQKEKGIEPVDYLKDYSIGANYKHAKFGIGILISEDKNTVVIKFEVGEKHLLKQFAKLEQA